MSKSHSDRIGKSTEWITGGDLVVAVEVEVVYPPDAPYEPTFRPETMRKLEHLRQCAERGDISELERVGRVYQRRISTSGT